MKSRIFAICDPESAYAAHLAEYLNDRKCTPFDVQAFTSGQALLAYAQDHPIELLLISSRAFTPQMKSLPASCTVLLSEGGQTDEEAAVPGSGREAPLHAVYKYQSSDSLISEVMEYYTARAPQPALYGQPGKTARIYGVFSPVHRCGKTSFALTLGEILAETGQTLYLPLEMWSGPESFLSGTPGMDLLDLLYFFREQDGSLLYRHGSIVKTFHNLQFIPPAFSCTDLAGVSAQEWLSLLDALLSIGEYENLVLEIGDGIDGLFPLLDRCDTVFMPVLDDPFSRAKILQFEQLASACARPDLPSRIRKIRPPVPAVQASGPDLVWQLLSGETGSYVRSLLWKEKT